MHSVDKYKYNEVINFDNVDVAVEEVIKFHKISNGRSNKMLKIALESLGCSKNLVDAEIMMGILNRKGYKLVGDFEEADIILVNTCGFIESAKQESIQTILELAQLKETANLKLLIVTGCLAQRYSEELKDRNTRNRCNSRNRKLSTNR